MSDKWEEAPNGVRRRLLENKAEKGKLTKTEQEELQRIRVSMSQTEARLRAKGELQ